tara:strand:+ start:260 stop:1177 length:918 start_codon:yes stop_codon:yes gene_type:complete
MKVYNLEPHYTKKEIAGRKGDWITEADYDYVIKDDCNAYGENGEPLFFFRKNKIPSNLCKNAWMVLRNAAAPTNNRGAAGGIIPPETKKTWDMGKIDKIRFNGIRKDGTLSNTTRANTVNSGVVGYFDRNSRFPYCRQTSWYAKNFQKFKQAYPYIHYINKLFSEACPAKYAKQKEIADKTNKDFIIKDTVFTTITVNKNFRTALHIDAGDCTEGLGNLAVLEAGDYEGGYTVIPRYRVAFDVRSGDVCFFNVHEYHANTEIQAQLAYERISIVCYYREKMHHCLSAKQELGRVQMRQKGESLKG